MSASGLELVGGFELDKCVDGGGVLTFAGTWRLTTLARSAATEGPWVAPRGEITVCGVACRRVLVRRHHVVHRPEFAFEVPGLFVDDGRGFFRVAW